MTEDNRYRYPLRDIVSTDKDGNQEYIGTEVTHLLSDKSWDDNLEPTGIYMAEVRDQKDKFIAFIDFNENEEGKIRECPHCLEYEIHNKLKPRILKKGEQQRPPDYDQFIQCWECGNIYPIYQSYPETEIKDSEETVQTPFENESIFLSTDNRATQRRKGKKRKSRFKIEEHEDPEIQAEIDKGNTVNILYDSSNYR